VSDRRRDFEIVDSVTASVALSMYDLVTRSGALADETTAIADIFGFVIEDAVAGDFVAVCRKGFCPVKQSDGESVAIGDTLVPSTTDGEVAVIASSGGGTAVVVAVAEETSNGNGTQMGAYVDCISYGRTATIPA
jgi:hypothetical protein